MKASDISDRLMLETVERCGREGPIGRDHPAADHVPGHEFWSMVWHIEAALKEFPPKVVHAKLKGMERRGLLDGCTCGCRGDFYLTPAGWAMLKAEAMEHPNRGEVHELTIDPRWLDGTHPD